MSCLSLVCSSWQSDYNASALPTQRSNVRKGTGQQLIANGQQPTANKRTDAPMVWVQLVRPVVTAMIYLRLLHKGASLCCFRDSASVTYRGMLPSDLTLSALRFILSAKARQSCKQDCETVDLCNSLMTKLFHLDYDRVLHIWRISLTFASCFSWC